jgi:hypothetical protein
MQLLTDGFAQEGIVIGARPQGLGGSFAAISGDPYSVFYNPAGIGELRQLSVSLFYARPVSGLTYGGSSLSHGGVFMPVSYFGTAGLNFIQRATDNGNITLLTENLLNFSWGKSLNKLISVGANFDYYFHQWNEEAIGDNPYLAGKTNSDGFGVDVGVQARITQSFHSGLTIENLLQPDIGLIEENKLPRKLIAGGLYQWEKAAPFLVLADLHWDFEESRQSWNFGIEKGIERAALRGGIETEADYFKWSLGAGYRFTAGNLRFCLDYAYTHTTGGLDWQPCPHVFSFTINFAKPGAKISKSKESPPAQKYAGESRITNDILKPHLKIKAYPRLVRFNQDNVADTLFIELEAEDIGQFSSGLKDWGLIFQREDKGSAECVLALEDTTKPPAILKWTGIDSVGKLAPNGWYRLIFTASDNSGNRTERRDVRFKLASKRNDPTPPVISFIPSDTLVSPDGDHKNDVLKFRINVHDPESEIIKWGLHIFYIDRNSVKKVVKTFGGKKRRIPSSITWRSDDDDWQRVTNGVYYAHFFVENEVGNFSETAPFRIRVQANEQLIRQRIKEEELEKELAVKEALKDIEPVGKVETPIEHEAKPEAAAPSYNKIETFLISGKKIIKAPSFYFTVSDKFLEESSKPALLMFISQLQNFPERSAVLQCYAANKESALKRGKDIKNYLVKQFSVEANRILVEGNETGQDKIEIRIKTKKEE